MVFREQTIVQVRSLVEKLESRPKPIIHIPESTESEPSPKTTPLHQTAPRRKLPSGRHSRTCLASGLFHAVYKGRMRKAKFLLDNGLNINSRNEYGYSVLVAALHIENGAKRSNMFQFLLDQEADPLLRDPRYKRNALSWAAILGRNEQVNLLLDCFMGEFDFHEKDTDGMTALHLATQAGHTEVVTALIREMNRYGTSVDVPDGIGLTPYLHAKRLGYGLIADILKDEGGACAGQGDTRSFKRADEWREIGIKERNEKAKLRRDSQYEQAAIAGSARMLMEFDGPGYEIISIPTPKTHRRHRERDVHSENGKDESSTKSVRIVTPTSHKSLPAGTVSRMPRTKFPHPVHSANGINTLSLIQMREPRRGLAPKQFRSSETDINKADEFPSVFGDLATMMDYLSMQNTKSFRQSVPPMEPKKSEGPVAPKRSTFSILFGKNKKGRKSPKSPRASACKKGKGSGKDKDRRSSKMSK